MTVISRGWTGEAFKVSWSKYRGVALPSWSGITGPADIDANTSARGRMAHALILEPHTVAADFSVMDGLQEATTAGGVTFIPQKVADEARAMAKHGRGLISQATGPWHAELALVAEAWGGWGKGLADLFLPNEGLLVDVKTDMGFFGQDSRSRINEKWKGQTGWYLHALRQAGLPANELAILLCGRSRAELVYMDVNECLEVAEHTWKEHWHGQA